MSRADRTAKKSVRVTFGSKKFEFRLYHRPLSLGDGLTIDYHWMDGGEFRKGIRGHERSLQNLRNCIGLWWRIVRSTGEQRNPQFIRGLLLSSCYGVFSRDKGQQRVYRDAFLGQTESPNWLNVQPNSFTDEVSEVTPEEISLLLRDLLGVPVPGMDEQRFAAVVIESILQHGVGRYLARGRNGVEKFVDKVEGWSKSLRKRGGRPLWALCLNQLAYAAKLSFYECYSNAWIALIQALEQQGLDPTSASFLRFWHWQNRNPSTDDGGQPGPLGGLVLGLHPISGYFMQYPELRTASADFFRELSPQDVDDGNFGERAAYRKFLGAIAAAANQYRQALDQTRKPHSRTLSADSDHTPASARSPESQLTEFFNLTSHRCAECRGALDCVSVSPQAVEGDQASLPARCRECGTQSAVLVEFDDLRRFLRRDPS